MAREMSAYERKLLHNYHELAGVERLRYNLLDRFCLDAERRFFFEGCRKIAGQMYIADRKGLYDTVLEVKPRYCFEIGTYTGGGSTFFLASAFARLGAGKVVTVESSDYLWKIATRAYKRYLPRLLPRVDFILGDSATVFEPFIRETGGVECVFLDGAEDAQQTLDQFKFFSGFLRPGTVLMAHDWNTDKMRLVKPLLGSGSGWLMRTLIEEPHSVGFAVLEYRPGA